MTHTSLREARDEQRPGRCPEWATTRSAVSSRFDDTYRCNRPVKAEVLTDPYGDRRWVAVCGIHARQYVERRAIDSPASEAPR